MRLPKNFKLSENPFLLFLPFLILYLVYILVFSKDASFGDEDRYVYYADNLLHGFYSPPYPRIDLGNGPGYPFMLVPFVALGIPFIWIKLLNAVFYYFSSVFLFKSLKQIVSHKFTLIFSLIWALYPNTFEQMLHRLPEVFATSLIPLLIFAILKSFKSDTIKNVKKYLILAGFTLGYVVLTKPVFGYVVIFMIIVTLALWILNRKNSNYKRSLMILAIALFTTVPYLFYTFHLTGKIFYLSSYGGNNLYWMSTPFDGEYGEYFKYPFSGSSDRIPGSEDQIKQRHQKDFDKLLQNQEVKKANLEDGVYHDDLAKGTDQDDLLKKIAIENIKSHPLKFLRNCISNMGRMIFNYPASYALQKPSTLKRLPINGTLMVFTLFCLIPTIVSWRKIPFKIRFLLFLIFLYLGASLLGSAETRMFTMAVPILLIWIAFIVERSVKVNLKLEIGKTS
jgi:4-amino-4-deoxy-L-arabinose transferase-like glycosyltransferase